MYLDEDEFARLADLTLLEVECHVLAAEATVEAHARHDAEVALHVAAHPTSRRAGLVAEAKRHALRERSVAEPHDRTFSRHCIDVACYGWRRDYDEWPSFGNLTDRLATDRNLKHGVAARRILDAVNDPTVGAHLYAIRTARLAEIIADEPPTLGVWEGEPADLCFYVSAEAMTPLVASQYRRRCWRVDAVA